MLYQKSVLAYVPSISPSNRHILCLFSARDESTIRYRDDRGTGNGPAGIKRGKSRLPVWQSYDEFLKLLCCLRTRATNEKH